jgi:RNA-splicing ligase RtcB
MILVAGKYNSASIFTDTVEPEALTTIQNLVNNKSFSTGRIAIMPDVHQGKGVVIGFTAHLGSDVIPNVVGVDIGCGVYGWNLGKLTIDFSTLDSFLRENIPMGFNTNTSVCENAKSLTYDVGFVCNKLKLDLQKVLLSIGSLGGGNHFIEVAKDQNDDMWLVIHSGSRNFGLQIANYHQKIAVERCGKLDGLEYLTGQQADSYLSDMLVAQRFAHANRMEMMERIVGGFFGLDTFKVKSTGVYSVHNYINFADGIIRKGAISANSGEKVLIPFNMADGSIIGVGKGNHLWNNSAPHGAGRIYSRTAAKKNLSLDSFKDKMLNVWSSCITEDFLDEAPMAYKNANDIENLIADTVEVTNRLKPVYNIKA